MVLGDANGHPDGCKNGSPPFRMLIERKPEILVHTARLTLEQEENVKTVLQGRRQMILMEPSENGCGIKSLFSAGSLQNKQLLS